MTKLSWIKRYQLLELEMNCFCGRWMVTNSEENTNTHIDNVMLKVCTHAATGCGFNSKHNPTHSNTYSTAKEKMQIQHVATKT